MPPPVKAVAPVDFAVIAAYMALMLVIGVYAMRFNRGAADYFKGGNRIHWLAAGLSSFMSGFSAWTFTGAAGLAYQRGLVAVLIYVGNACTFLLGYFLFAQRWRRARIGTVMEYLVDRYDEKTRQAFSWTTIFFQLFMGGAMLYGLALFVAPTCGWPLSWTIVGSQAVILAYCVVGGLWAVVITDFLQAAILMPFTLVMFFASLARVGGLSGLLHGLPPESTTLALAPGHGWTYVLCWTVMTSFGYNTAAMAQRYFSVEDERASRKVALLCFSLFLVGAFIWFVPPFAVRVLHPDLAAIWPHLANPHESSYALAALTLLPSGLVGVMLAAMFSATMSSLSGLLNIHASIISRDIFPTLFPRRAGEAERLVVGWTATFAVGVAIMAIALAMALGRYTVFGAMVTFNTVMSLAYGPPALLGLVVRRTPSWSGIASFAVALAIGAVGSFVLGWGLVANVLVVVPVSVAVFFASRLVPGTDPAHAARRDDLFRRLDTPVDVAAEIGETPDPTADVFRFLSRTTGLIGLLCVPFVFTAAPGERSTAAGYVAITLVLAAALLLVGRHPRPSPRGPAPSSRGAPSLAGDEGSAASVPADPPASGRPESLGTTDPEARR
jgi:SSS family transporter